MAVFFSREIENSANSWFWADKAAIDPVYCIKNDQCALRLFALLVYLLSLLLMISSGNLACAENNLSSVQKELDQSTKNLRKIERKIIKNAKNHALLKAESKKIDQEIGKLHRQLQHSNADVLSNKEELQGLEKKQIELAEELLSHKEAYKKQLRAVYSLQSQSKWKFIFSQASLQNMARNAAIYDYIHQAQLREIEQINRLNENINFNRTELLAQQAKLRQLVQQQSVRQAVLIKTRKQKQQIQVALSRIIKKDRAAFQNEQEKKASLKKLLNQLERSAATSGRFAQYTGKLPWPVQGKQQTRFGESKKGTAGVNWTGVFLHASRGTEIYAIFAGTVVFADWFDRYGWLMIVDHGDDFMTLYAHAEGLYKNVGDYVKQGEAIAAVGDSGDTEQTNLYFEIRHQGNPVDPAKWCTNMQQSH